VPERGAALGLGGHYGAGDLPRTYDSLGTGTHTFAQVAKSDCGRSVKPDTGHGWHTQSLVNSGRLVIGRLVIVPA
jgi:hypothetical protein